MKVSVIIPNRNGSKTIGALLDALTGDENLEVVVVDDASEDRSIEVISTYRCKLIGLKRQRGASYCRNLGAGYSRGDILFFTDADCLVEPETVLKGAEMLRSLGRGVILGGTYTPLPQDRGLFSVFQSLFIYYSEIKRAQEPDYIATHALFIHREDFLKLGGFRDDLFPILEDVEFSHRARKSGFNLILEPALQVRHYFGYDLLKSMRNAVRKSHYWSIYSLQRGDLLVDSGTASHELKAVSAGWALSLATTIAGMVNPTCLLIPLLLFLLCLFISRHLLRTFFREGGMRVLLTAGLYFLFVYPLPVLVGGLSGLFRYMYYRLTGNPIRVARWVT